VDFVCFRFYFVMMAALSLSLESTSGTVHAELMMLFLKSEAKLWYVTHASDFLMHFWSVPDWPKCQCSSKKKEDPCSGPDRPKCRCSC
jgi:hypothetical protein